MARYCRLIRQFEQWIEKDLIRLKTTKLSRLLTNPKAPHDFTVSLEIRGS